MSRRAVYHNEGAQREPPLDAPFDSSAVQAFHASLPSYAPTPLIALPSLDGLGLGPVYVKDESSRLGLPSFKILGASYAAFCALAARLSLTSPSVAALREALALQPLTLFAATDGNHGRAVARMGAYFGAEAEIYVPSGVPAGAVSAIRSEGARVSELGCSYDAAVQAAHAAAQRSGGVCVQDTAWPGYEQVPAWIVQGYATMLAEIAAELPRLPALVVVPVGVGSLAQAVVEHCSGATKVLAVEPEAAACLWESLSAGRVTTVDTRHTVMTGMNCGTVSSAAWPVLRSGVDACVAITDDEAADAMRELHAAGVKAGACGAAGLAALKRLQPQDRDALGLNGGPVVLLCTEGYEAAEGHE